MNDLLRYPLRPGSRLLALLAVALVGLAGLPGLASAQDEGSEPLSYVPADLYPMLPASGVYYDHGHGGTGLTIDFDKSGYVFAVFYSYTESGEQAYYLMQGNYVPSSEDELYSTGILGRFDAEPYLSVNGECVGESCTYKSPDAVTTGLSASIVWTTARRATITIGSQSWDVQKGLVVPEEDLLVGTWSMVVTGQYSEDWSHPVASSAVVEVEKAPGITASMFESRNGASVPLAGSVIYELTCANNASSGDVSMNSTYQSCESLLGRLRADFDGDGDGLADPPVWPLRSFLFYEPQSGRAGLVSVQDVFGTLVVGDILPTHGIEGNYGTGSLYGELSVVAGTIRGRAYSEWQVGTPKLDGDIVMTRLVDGTLRFRRDSGDDVDPVE